MTTEVTRVLSRMHLWPIDLAVARTSTQLDFSSDPADEIIAATSVVHDVPLLTRDRIVRTSKIVPLLVDRMAQGRDMVLLKTTTGG